MTKARINRTYVTLTLCLCQLSHQDGLFRFIVSSLVSLDPSRKVKLLFPPRHFTAFISKVIDVIIFHGDAPRRVTAQG